MYKSDVSIGKNVFVFYNTVVFYITEWKKA